MQLMINYSYKLLFCFFALLLFSSAQATINNIEIYEYFFDIDPGVGQGKNIAINQSEFSYQDANLDISDLSPGFHKLYIRAKDSNGNWGIPQGRPFFIQFPPEIRNNAKPAKIEYYFDNPKNSSFIDFESGNSELLANINIKELETGYHKLYISLHDDSGVKGIIQSKPVYLQSSEDNNTMNAKLNNIEYFFDKEPDVGNGKRIDLLQQNETQTFNIDISSLNEGFHKLYIRAINDNNIWGTVQSKPLFIQFSNDSITKSVANVEYFFDQEPGFGNGTKLDINSQNTVSSEQIILKKLEPGYHKLHVRFQDNEGTWGIIQTRPIYIASKNIGNTKKIHKLEYFFNKDPGFGKGVAFIPELINSVISLETNIFLSNLETGNHNIYVRAQNDDNQWGIPQSKSIYYQAIIKPILRVTPLIQNVSAQGGNVSFFIDNKGTGTLSWDAEIIEGNSWLSITKNSGVGDDTLIVKYESNNISNQRLGRVLISAKNAGSSPQTLEIKQSYNSKIIISPVNDITINEDEILDDLSFTISYSGNNQITITGSSSDTSLINNVIINKKENKYFINILPEKNQNGSTLITITASDNEISATESFNINVIAINDPPSFKLSKDYIELDENSQQVTTITIIPDLPPDDEEDQNIKYSIVPLNNDLLDISINETLKEIFIKPNKNRNGTQTFKIIANDQQSINATFIAELLVNIKSIPPQIICPENQIIKGDTAIEPIDFSIIYDEEDLDTISINALSSNNNIIPDENLTIEVIGSNSTITIQPIQGQSGLSNITLQIFDGKLQDSCSFSVNVDQEEPACSFIKVGGNSTDPVWTVYLEGAKLNGFDLQPADFISVYDGEVLVGSFILDQVINETNRFDNDLIVWSTLDTGKGYHEGNKYTFKCCTSGKIVDNYNIVFNNDNQFNDSYKGQVFPEDEAPYSIAKLEFSNNINKQPVAYNASISLLEDENITDDLIGDDKDNDTLIFSLVSQPSIGVVTITKIHTGTYSYVPDANENGVDSFNFKVNDGSFDSNIATVNISITPVNDSPTISGIPQLSVLENNQYQFKPEAHDVDLDDKLRFSIENCPLWAIFDEKTGSLIGTPKKIDVGLTTDIVIKVYDTNEQYAVLNPFNIEVIQDFIYGDIDGNGSIGLYDLIAGLQVLANIIDDQVIIDSEYKKQKICIKDIIYIIQKL